MLNVTENAATRIRYLIEREDKGLLKLRIAVDGGGCSGFQYRYEFTNTINADDTVIQKNGIEVVIDSTSAPFLEGVTFDYVETLGAAAFEIKNPNASSKCGCGNSFAI